MIYVTYDPGAAYPQPALFGRGIESGGTHVPPSGLDSFGVDESTLTEGIDERFYEVTSAAVLAIKADAADTKLEDNKQGAYLSVDTEAERRIALAESNPSIGQNLDENGRIRNNNRRNNKAKRQVNEITSADDHLFDHTDLIYDAAELISDDIEAATTHAQIDDILVILPTDIRFPSWAPI